jgi:hypothetical protein
MAINNLSELADAIGAVHETEESIARRVYKSTACGACFWIVAGGVGVAGYVEGWDGQCPEHVLDFPFEIEDFDQALQLCDEEADEIFDQIQPPTAVERLARALTPESE